MTPPRTRRLAALLLTCLASFPFKTQAQYTSTSGAGGMFSSTWTNIKQAGRGDTVVVRTVFINTGDTAIVFRPQSCGLSIVTSAALRDVDERCGRASGPLTPGDSVWAERRWILESGPGRFEYEIRNPMGGSSGSSAEGKTTDRLKQAASDRRLPIVLRTSIQQPDSLAVAHDVQTVVRYAIPFTKYHPMFTGETAARAMQAQNPWLQLSVKLSQTDDFDFEACWFDRRGEPLGACGNRLSGAAPPMLTGAMLKEFVERVVAQADVIFEYP